MKSLAFVIIMVATPPFIHSQETDIKSYSFSTIKLQPKIVFEPVLDSVNTLFTENSTLSFAQMDMDQTNYIIKSKALNKRLFSNIKIIENTYLDHDRFLRGCGYLEDGITNPIDGAGFMFSSILNNFVNNVLLTKGIFSKNYYLKR
jgi:hypothetical protein